jgi:hypothetical protein
MDTESLFFESWGLCPANLFCALGVEKNLSEKELRILQNERSDLAHDMVDAPRFDFD